MIDKFLDYLSIERRYSALTVRAYKNDLDQFCQFLNIDPNELQPQLIEADDIKKWAAHLMRDGNKSRSINRKLSSVRSYFKFCRQVGIIDNDITHTIVRPKNDKPLPAFYTESDMQQALEGEAYADDFETYRDNLLIEMLYQTGMRCAELMGLKDADINLAEHTIRVFGKRKKERIIPIGDNLCQQITIYVESRNQQFGTTDTFFVTIKGKPMYQKCVYNIVHNRMIEYSTIEKQSPHVLRHTFATTMLNNGADINTIKKLLGHANLAATQIYTHTSIEQLKNVYNNAHPRAKK